MKDREPCMLWEGARLIGEPRGLILHGECPVISVCDGPHCIYQSPRDFGPQTLEKFITRLEKHFEIQDAKRLEELRRELINEG